MQKARRLVNDVMVTEIADVRNISPTRSSIVCCLFVLLQPVIKMNMSSTPTPERRDNYH